MIRNFSEFCAELSKASLSSAVGGKGDGMFGLFHYGWNAESVKSKR